MSPAEQASKYKDHGFKNLHIVDLDGALTGKTVNLDIIKEISNQYDLKIQIAGLSQDSDFLVTRGNKNDCKFSVCHFKNNRLKAVECINDQKTFMLGKKLIEAESKITPEAIENIQTNLRDWK